MLLRMYMTDSTILIKLELEDRFNNFKPKIVNVLYDPNEPFLAGQLEHVVQNQLNALVAEELRNTQLLKQLVRLLVNSPITMVGLQSKNHHEQQAALDLVNFIKDCFSLLTTSIPDTEPVGLKIVMLINAVLELNKDPQNEKAHKALQAAAKALEKL